MPSMGHIPLLQDFSLRDRARGEHSTPIGGLHADNSIDGESWQLLRRGQMARLPGLPRTDQTHRPSRDGQRARSSLQMLDPKASGRPDRSQSTAES